MDMGNLMWRPTLCGTADAALHGMHVNGAERHIIPVRGCLARQRSRERVLEATFPVRPHAPWAHHQA